MDFVAISCVLLLLASLSRAIEYKGVDSLVDGIINSLHTIDQSGCNELVVLVVIFILFSLASQVLIVLLLQTLVKFGEVFLQRSHEIKSLVVLHLGALEHFLKVSPLLLILVVSLDGFVSEELCVSLVGFFQTLKLLYQVELVGLKYLHLLLPLMQFLKRFLTCLFPVVSLVFQCLR